MAKSDFPSDFVDRLYAVAMEPERFTEIIEVWHARFSELPSDGESRFSDEIAYLENHLSRAEQLLFIATSHEEILPTPLHERLRSEPQAMIAIDAGGVIQGSNGAAERVFSAQEGDLVSGLPLEQHVLTDLETRIRGLAKPETPRARTELIRAWHSDTHEPLILAVSTISTASGRSLLLIKSVDFIWPEQLTPLLQEAFSLTLAETTVMKLFAEGNSIKDIATSRDTSIATVRSQIRAIYDKTSTRNQSELMRVMLGLANLDLIDRLAVTGAFEQISTSTLSPYPRESDRHLLDLPDGRMLDYAVFGAPGGKPCIHFHNEFFGDGWSAKMVQEASQRGLLIIVPCRAGNGRTTDYPGGVSTFRQTTEDTLFLLDHLGVEKAVHVSHMAGGAFSLAFASRAPDRTAGVVFLTPTFPHKIPDADPKLPYFHKVLSKVVHEHPRLLEFLCRTGIAFHNRVGTRRFFRAFAKQRPADLAVLEDEDAFNAMSHGARVCAAQGHLGFFNDFRETLPHAWELFQALQCPVDVVIGDQTSPSAVEGFSILVDTLPNYHRTVAPGGAHYVMHSHQKLVVEALERVWRRADP